MRRIFFADFRPGAGRVVNCGRMSPWLTLAALGFVVASGGSAAADPGPEPTPCFAHAGVRICFGDQPTGTKVDSQYAASGVTFGKGLKDSGVTPTVQHDGVSANHVAVITKCSNAGEFCSARAWGAFAIERTYVRVRVGSPGTGSGAFVVLLDAFKSNGENVGTAQATIGKGWAKSKLLQINNPKGPIAFFRVGIPQAGPALPLLAIDDVAFSKATGTEQPDFSLTPDPIVQSIPLSLKPGTSTFLGIDIHRVNGSSGPIALDLADAPAGVTATFDPKNAAGSHTVMKITAAANAPSTPVGSQFVVVRGTPQPSAGTGKRTTTVNFKVLANYDVALTAIEVTQGIQKEFETCDSKALCGLRKSLQPASQPGASVAYSGVHLAAHGKTVVRAFATVLSPTLGSVDDVWVQLHGSLDGQKLPGSPLQAWGLYPPKLKFHLVPWVTYQQRADPAGAYTFVLPDSWTTGKIKLKAEVLPGQPAIYGTTASECDQPACATNNTFTLTDVKFSKQPYITISPLYLKAGNEFPLWPPSQVFAPAANLTPVGDLDVAFPPSFYYAELDVTDIAFDASLSSKEKRGEFNDEIWSWAEDHPGADNGRPGVEDVVIGVHSFGWSSARGKLLDSIVSFGGGVLQFTPVANVTYNKAYNAVAHELHHTYVRKHASGACGAGSDGQIADLWPPDQQGFMHGIGLDRRSGSGGPNTGAPFAIMAHRDLGAPPGVPGGSPQPNRYYDFMAYVGCSPIWDGVTGSPWTSWEGWDKSFLALHAYGAITGRNPFTLAVPASRAALSVRARGSGSEFEITRVRPVRTTAPLELPPSRLSVVAYDTAGRRLSTTPATLSDEHVDGQPPETVATAYVPGPGGSVDAIARVEIVLGGRPVAARTRSAHAPTVELLQPRTGALPPRGSMTVRWRARDDDGDRLRVSVDYSQDDGKSWRTVWSGPNRGAVALDASRFPRSDTARLRVRAEDTFGSAAAASERLTAAGSPPTVTIASPSTRDRIGAGTEVYLSGVGYDDSLAQLDESELRWFDDRRSVGRGRHASVTLSAGSHLLRLVARDRFGRRGQTAVRVRVAATPPRFTVLELVKGVKRGDTTVLLRVAATGDAALSANGSPAGTVSESSRVISIHIPPLAHRAEVTLRLQSGAMQSTTRLIVTG